MDSRLRTGVEPPVEEWVVVWGAELCDGFYPSEYDAYARLVLLLCPTVHDAGSPEELYVIPESCSGDSHRLLVIRRGDDPPLVCYSERHCLTVVEVRREIDVERAFLLGLDRMLLEQASFDQRLQADSGARVDW